MTRTQYALAMFHSGFNCSQSVLAAFAEDAGLSAETALKIASGFGGGMGRLSLTCGAVTGAFMALGLQAGYSSDESRESREIIYRLVQELADQFRTMHGSIECRKLLGFDISKTDGYRSAADKGVFLALCPRFVQSAVEITEKLLTIPDEETATK